jgi:hypothetical protein
MDTTDPLPGAGTPPPDQKPGTPPPPPVQPADAPEPLGSSKGLREGMVHDGQGETLTRKQYKEFERIKQYQKREGMP